MGDLDTEGIHMVFNTWKKSHRKGCSLFYVCGENGGWGVYVSLRFNRLLTSPALLPCSQVNIYKAPTASLDLGQVSTGYETISVGR